MKKRWVINTPPPAEKVESLSKQLNCNRVIASLLLQRGVTTAEEAKAFFNPALNRLHDPFLMQDMDKAVARLEKAIAAKERVLIYGDYDVDGTTAVALLYKYLKNKCEEPQYYIPDRDSEGCGISCRAIDYAAKNGITLMIVTDCGVKAVEEVAGAKARGIDMIICDHHLPENDLPAAVAVLDPKRADCGYPFDDLSGCGVGFKLVQAYSQRYGIAFETLVPLLDLLVVSIASDLVTMVDENRILAHFGLRQLNTSPCNGLLALINLCKIDPGHITIDDIVFKIGPRINAAGRIDSGRFAVELLTAGDIASAMRIGEKINESNNERKSIDREITREALEMVQNGHSLSRGNATIVYNPRWNKGVVGIVASRLVEAYYRPTVVLTRSNGFVTGSARSITGFDLYGAIESCADLLENFGGHVYAAGLTLREEKLEEFANRMDAYVEAHITEDMLTPVIDVDARLDFAQITPKFFRILKQFQPFGPGNHNPVFMTENVYDAGSGRKVGAGGVHLKLDLIQESQPYHQIPSIAFNMSQFYDYIREGNPFDVCYTIVENYYRGNSSIQLRVRDLHEREELL